MKTIEKLTLVYCVTSYGKIVGVYASSEDAFQVQMAAINKGRICELVPMSIVYPLNDSKND